MKVTNIKVKLHSVSLQTISSFIENVEMIWKLEVSELYLGTLTITKTSLEESPNHQPAYTLVITNH